MRPKRTENISKSHRLSQSAVSTVELHENQHCVGKFAADWEFCCRKLSSNNPIHIPVYIRGHSPLETYSEVSTAPSIIGDEEQKTSSIKFSLGGRFPSINQNGTLASINNENRPFGISGHESLNSTASSYRTFRVLQDGDFYRPTLLVDSTGHENEPIDQIKALYMRAWQLDQRFLDIFKEILPLQEQLHTLNFCFVGLNEKTIYRLIEVCQLIKNLKTLLLDGNPLAADHFHIFIENTDLKIVHLSLRFCKITDLGAERLANRLGNISTQNWNLLSLTLTGNEIGDHGAASFAKALRYNRSLISLNLSLNFLTDIGACALALVLRKFVLTHEEIVQRRFLISEHYGDAYGNELAPSPALSSISGRDSKRLSESNKRRKSITVKDKHHRIELDENRPSSRNKGDQKKGKTDGTIGRSGSVDRRSSLTDQGRTSAHVRGKKSASSTGSASKKNISMVHEDEDTAEKLTTLPMLRIERENPLLEKNVNRSRDGEISLKGNFVLLTLNLSRNYLTLNTVNEFLLSIQYQTTLTHFNPTAYTSLIDFHGLSRLELKGMKDISMKSPIYQSLEVLLREKNPLVRFQGIKEHEMKEFLDQQVVPEKTRVASNIKSTGSRSISRPKD